MAYLVKEDVALDPVAVGLLSAAAVVAGAQGLAQAVDQLGRARFQRCSNL